MSIPAIVMMVLIGSIVWGGFLFFLVRALRSESAKRSADGDQDRGSGVGPGPGPSP